MKRLLCMMGVLALLIGGSGCDISKSKSDDNSGKLVVTIDSQGCTTNGIALFITQTDGGLRQLGPIGPGEERTIRLTPGIHVIEAATVEGNALLPFQVEIFRGETSGVVIPCR